MGQDAVDDSSVANPSTAKCILLVRPLASGPFGNWENVHLLFAGRGVVTRLQAMTRHYLQWCKGAHHSPFVTKITRDTLGWKNATKEPTGGWHKGNLTSLFCRWFQALYEERWDDIDREGLVDLSGQAVTHLNSFLRLLYTSDVFIQRERGLRIAEHCRAFLALYQKLATEAFKLGKPLFPLLPKAHALDHQQYELFRSIERCGFAISPMIAGCQMDEDFIGRPSRISRKVSPRQASGRTCERYLIAAKAAWVKAGMLN